MAFLCAACWCWVFGGSYPPWVRRSAHCKPPTQSSRATGGGEWLPPVAPPVCHQHPSHPQGLGQHKQTTSWAGRSQFGFLLVETAVKRATSSEIGTKNFISGVTIKTIQIENPTKLMQCSWHHNCSPKLFIMIDWESCESKKKRQRSWWQQQ